MRFLAVFILIFSLSFVSYGQLESNFFQQNQIFFNPAALSAESDVEGLVGGKTSSYEKYRRPSILYNAAAVRIKRFTVVGTSDLAWERLTNSGNISLSAGFNIFKKENLSISVAMGGIIIGGNTLTISL